MDLKVYYLALHFSLPRLYLTPWYLFARFSLQLRCIELACELCSRGKCILLTESCLNIFLSACNQASWWVHLNLPLLSQFVWFEQLPVSGTHCDFLTPHISFEHIWQGLFKVIPVGCFTSDYFIANCQSIRGWSLWTYLSWPKEVWTVKRLEAVATETTLGGSCLSLWPCWLHTKDGRPWGSNDHF